MSDIRYPSRSDVELPVTAEIDVVCRVAALLITQGIERCIAIPEAFRVFDDILKLSEERTKKRREEEFRRRRGY